MAKRTQSVPEPWRKRGEAALDEQSDNLLLRRWLYTLAAAALVGLLVYVFYVLIWNPRTTVAVLPITYSQQQLPLNPAPDQGLSQINERVPKIEMLRWDDYQRSDSGWLEQIKKDAAELSKRRSDVLVIYVNGHGVSRNGNPYLLFSDFQVDSRSWERYAVEVSKVLEALDGTPGVKLLAIESGRLPRDARLGVVANAFPRLVEQAVQSVEDERLFVLASHASFESTAGFSAKSPSPFTYFLAKGLGGDADLQANREVTLGELYRYVQSNTLGVSGSGGEAQQTPILMQGGLGIVHYDPDRQREMGIPAEEVADRLGVIDALALVSKIRHPPDEDEAAADDAGGAEGESSDDPPADSEASDDAATSDENDASSTASASTDSSGENESADDEDTEGESSDSTASSDSNPAEDEEDDKKPDSDGSPPPATTLLVIERIWKAWELSVEWDRDLWSPIDAAPHLWRRVEARLLRFEQECRNRSLSPAMMDRGQDLAKSLERLNEFLKAPSRPPDFRGAELQEDLDSIVRRVGEFRSKVSRTSSIPGAADSVALLDRVERVFNNATYLLRGLLERQSRASSRTVDSGPHYQRAFEQNSDVLTQYELFSRTLKKLEDSSSAVDADAEKRLTQQMTAVKSAALLIRNQLDREVSEAIQASGAVAARRIDDLLATTLLSAPQRLKLLAAIEVEPRDRGEAQLGRTPISPPAEHADRWSEVSQWIDLERAVWQLADPALAASLPADQLGSDDQANWRACSDIGGRLGDLYGGLPEELPSKGRLSDAQALRKARVLLSLLDPRDAERVPSGVSLGRNYNIQPRTPRPKLQIVGSGPSSRRLSEDPANFPISIRHQEVFEPIRFSLDFLEQQLEVEYHGAPVASGEEVELRSEDELAETIPLVVRAKLTQDAASAETIVVRLKTAGARPVTSDIEYWLPLPNEIDLLVNRDGSTEVLGSGADVLQLFCFPCDNPSEEPRFSEFRFSLQNHSGISKSIQVQLLRVPPNVPRRTWPTGTVGRYGQVEPAVHRAVFAQDAEDDPAYELKDGVLADLLIAEADVELRADDRRVYFQFGAPAAAAAGESADGDAPAATPPPAASGAIDVSHGLVCLLTNKAKPAERIVKWLEIRPLHPSLYARGDARFLQGKIEVGVTPKISNDKDGEADQSPWSTEHLGVIRVPQWGRNNVSQGGRVSLSEPGFALDGSTTFVGVDVDGYPRAFPFAIQHLSSGRVDDFSQGTALERARVSRVIASIRSSEPGGKLEEKSFEIRGQNDPLRIVLPECERIKAIIQVDVPERAFVKQGDRIWFEVGGDAKGGTYYSDRRVQTLLESPSGHLRFVTRISDHEVVTGVRDLDVEFPIIVHPPSGVTDFDQTEVLLFVDTQRPYFRNQLIDVNDIKEGETLRAKVFVADDGALAQLEFGIDVGPEGLDPGDTPRSIDLSGTAASPTIEVLTEKLPAGSYTLAMRVHDQVGLTREYARRFRVEAGSAGEDEVPQVGIIIGQVVDFADKPVTGSGWTLTLKGGGIEKSLELNSKIEGARFDQDATFQFDDLPLGEYTVQITHSSTSYPKGDKKSGKAEPKDKAKLVTLKATKDNLEKLDNP